MTPHDEKELSRYYPGVNLNSAQLKIIESLRVDFCKLAERILNEVPSSADRSAAMRYLRLAQMQVNAAISHDWPEQKNDNELRF